MSGDKAGSDDTFLKQAISAFVSITHVIAFFQIVICSRHMAVAFDIPAKNIGIYFAKLYSLRSLLMSMGCTIEYGIYRIVQTFCSNMAIDIRKYLSMIWFCLLTVCEVSFLYALYFSKRVAYHNYIVLNIEGMFFGFFQMSILSLIPEFASYYMLSLYVSGTCIFIIQTIIDKCTKNSMLSVKIQSWICVFCSIESVALWTYYLIKLYKDTTQQTSQGTNAQSSQTCNSGTSQGSMGSHGAGAGSGVNGSSVGGGGTSGSSTSPSEPAPTSPKEPAPVKPKMEYLISMSSLTVLKIVTHKLGELCQSLNPMEVVNVQILIARLQQITREKDISYDVLVAIDLVILSLKKCSCSSDELCLLEELSLFLRIKVLVKTEQTQVIQVSDTHGHTNIDGYGDLPVRTLLYTYPVYGYPYGYVGSEESILRAKRSPPGERQRTKRVKRNSEKPAQTSKPFHEHLWHSLSQLMMFPIGSLVKDFLFPGVIPYGLLERDKCHLINLIVIIFLSVGPVTIFVLSLKLGDTFKKDNTYIHLCWSCMAPKILILIISLCAIHTKRGCTHKIRSSQSIVLFMTVVLLTCYGFLETMSFVGMAFYVKLIAQDPSGTVDLQAIHNVSGKFFRYFVYKLSVGYNKTRISSGFTLPNFKPPEPIGNTFGFWFKGAFANGWKDIKGDFKMGIKQYLAATQTVSKKSPLESLRYCDLLM